MLNLNAMFNTSCDVFDTREGDNGVNNKSLDADYLLNDLSSSINAISSQFSALMSSHNRISDMYSYIRLYGVDRACVQIYNRDGLLTDLSNGVVPATEDFRESNVSKYTIACMEGLGEAIIKIFKWCWEKLKAIGKWIGEKVVAAFNWILSLFKSDKKKEEEIADLILKLETKAAAHKAIRELAGIEDISSTSGTTYSSEDRRGANEVMNRIRQRIGDLNNWVRYARDRLDANLKKINTFTEIIDKYGDAADDDSKFEEVFRRAMSEEGEKTGNRSPDSIKETIKKAVIELKDIASNPLRFKDFNEIKNSFNQHRSLRSQFEDVMAEARSLAEQTRAQMNSVCERGQNTINKLNKVPYDHFVITHRHEAAPVKSAAWRENMPPEMKELRATTSNFSGLKEELKYINQNADVVESIVRVATGLNTCFRKNMDIYDDTVKGITRQMKNKKDE